MPYRPNFPIPENIHAELQCLQIMIPNDVGWKSVVQGLFYELQYWFNWERDEFNSGRECAAVWKEIYKSIDWSTMSCCCDQSIIYQWVGDGTLQQSTDDGATWTDVPQKDPRNNSTIFPPISGSDGDDKKCVAATGMVELIREQVGDNLTDDMSRFTLGELVSTWIETMLQTSNPFDALMRVISNQIFALIISAVRAALTDDAYAGLLCAFYCNMSDDGSFTESQWLATRTSITDRVSGIAGVFFEHLVYLLGQRGLTNLARSAGAAEGDCSDCHCDDTWCKEFDFTTASHDEFWSSYNTAINPAVYNTAWVADTGWQTANGSPNYSIIKVAIDTSKLTRVTFTLDPSTDSTAYMGILTAPDGGELVNYAVNDRFFDGSEPDGSYLGIGQRDRAVLTYVRLEGTGTNPFGTDNC